MNRKILLGLPPVVFFAISCSTLASIEMRGEITKLTSSVNCNFIQPSDKVLGYTGMKSIQDNPKECNTDVYLSLLAVKSAKPPQKNSFGLASEEPTDRSSLIQHNSINSPKLWPEIRTTHNRAQVFVRTIKEKSSLSLTSHYKSKTKQDSHRSSPVDINSLQVLPSIIDLKELGPPEVYSGFEPYNTHLQVPEHGRHALDISGSDWDTVPYSKVNLITLSQFDESFVIAETFNAKGPNGLISSVLALGVNRDDPDYEHTSRAELSLWHPPNQGYTRYWMKIVDDFSSGVVQGEKGWRIIMEWKEPDSGIGSNTNNWRMGIDINHREREGNTTPAWCLFLEQVQPERVLEHIECNLDIPVPIGEWFLVEAMYKIGNNGRLSFAINGDRVFDYYGRTQHKDNPLGVRFWSVMKNYHMPDWNNPTLQLYDDLEIWHQNIP